MSWCFKYLLFIYSN